MGAEMCIRDRGTTIDPLRPGSVFAANALCGGLTAELPRG